MYIDYLQIGAGQLIVAPFSARPLPGAPVSTPLRWSEVNERLDIRSFTVRRAGSHGETETRSAPRPAQAEPRPGSRLGAFERQAMTAATDLQLHVSDEIGQVSALLLRPPDSWLLYVLAHGAGAGMRHRFLESISLALAERGIGTLRYQFPYMEAGRRRPDPPPVAQATVRAAAEKAAEVAPGLPLVAGGKSFGGRMTSAAAAVSPLAGVKGLVFLGFPLHPPGQPGTSRADHLDRVDVPMLFLQGTRDQFARVDLITDVSEELESNAALHLVDEGDHSFGVPKRSGRSPVEVLTELTDTIEQWSRALVAGPVRA